VQKLLEVHRGDMVRLGKGGQQIIQIFNQQRKGSK